LAVGGYPFADGGLGYLAGIEMAVMTVTVTVWAAAGTARRGV